MPDQKAEQYRGGRDHIVAAVRTGRDQRHGVDFFAGPHIEARLPDLDADGKQQDDHDGQAEFRRCRGKNLLDRALAQLQPHDDDDNRNQKPRQILDAGVPVRMLLVLRHGSQLEAD